MEDMKESTPIKTFTDNATLVSARVYLQQTLDSAFEKTVELCAGKPQLQHQMPSAPVSKDKIMAAPNLNEELFGLLADKCTRTGGIALIRDGLRNYPGGIDMGVTIMDFGIAETGTLVLDGRFEETRLATMLSEWHVAILFTSKIRESAAGMTDELNALIEETGAYTTFITGASRTADIERVLAIGVHGPLELHIILVEE